MHSPKAMKRLLSIALCVCILFSFPATAHAKTSGDSVSVGTDGSIVLTSDHFGSEEVSTMSLRFTVTPAIEGSEISFKFDEGVTSLIKQFKDTSDTVKTLYLAGGTLMGRSQTELTLGKLSVTKDGEAVAADVSVAADGLSYVQGGSSQVTATIEAVSAKLTGKGAEDLGTVDLGIDMSTSFTAPESGVPDDWFFSFMSSLCAFPGGQVTYCFKVYNTHISKYNVQAHNVVLKDVIPEGFTVAKVSGAGKYEYEPSTRTATWTFDTISGTKVKDASTVYLTLNIPNTPTQAGWNNYATASADNGNEPSYHSKPADVGDEYQEDLYYAYCLMLDSNGGTDNADGLPYFFFRLNNIENGKTSISDDPAMTIDFPGDWYVGYTGSSYGGDPGPDAGMGENVIFAGWSTEKHTGVQTKKPDDMVAYIENGSIHGSYTFTGLSTLYAVWANDDDGNGNPDWEKAEPADLTQLNNIISRVSAMDSSMYSNWNDTVKPALDAAKALVARGGELTKDNDQSTVDAAVDALEKALEKLTYSNEFVIDEEGNVTLKTKTLASANATSLQVKIHVTPAFTEGVTVKFEQAQIKGDPRVTASYKPDTGTLDIEIVSADGALFEQGTTEVKLGKISVTNQYGKNVQASIAIKNDDVKYQGADQQLKPLNIPEATSSLSGLISQNCNHSWDEGHVKQAATCLTNGVMEYTCKLCGAPREETITAKGSHTVTKYTHSEGTGADSKHTWVCDVCGESGTEACSFSKSDSTDASCVKPATETFTCEKCGFSYSTNVAGSSATGHVPAEQRANVKAATCTADGYTGDSVCSVCGEVLESGKTIRAKGHVAAGEREGVKTSTCTADGYTGDVRCTVCGEIIEKGVTIPASGHTPAAKRENAKAATCTTAGFSGDLRCTVCGKVIEKGAPVPAAGHKPASTRENASKATCTFAGFTGDLRCTVCGEVIEAGHTIAATGHTPGKTRENFKAATCTEAGHTGVLKCAVCGVVMDKGQTISPLGHKWDSEWTYDSTSHWHKCARCSATSGKAAHTAQDKLANVKAATCKESGYSGDKVCSECGYVITKGAEVKALGHEYADTWQHDADGHWRVCLRCKEKQEPEKHTPAEVRSGTIVPSCVEEGYTGDLICSVCGEVLEKGQVVAKTEHNFKNGKCSYCGLKEKDAETTGSSGSGTGSSTGSSSSGTHAEKPAKSAVSWLKILIGALCIAAVGGGILFIIVLRRNRDDENAESSEGNSDEDVDKRI